MADTSQANGSCDHMLWFAWDSLVYDCCPSVIINSIPFHSQSYPGLDNKCHSPCLFPLVIAGVSLPLANGSPCRGKNTGCAVLVAVLPPSTVWPWTNRLPELVSPAIGIMSPTHLEGLAMCVSDLYSQGLAHSRSLAGWVTDPGSICYEWRCHSCPHCTLMGIPGA